MSSNGGMSTHRNLGFWCEEPNLNLMRFATSSYYIYILSDVASPLLCVVTTPSNGSNVINPRLTAQDGLNLLLR